MPIDAMAGLLLALGAIGLAAQVVRIRYEARMMAQLVHSYRWHDAYRSLLIDPR